MTVLVTGATGSIGREVTAALLARGADVRALVRGPERARLLPPDAKPVVADLRDAASVEAALAGATAALYVSPHDPDEERMAATFVAACERLGVRLVFAGVHVSGYNVVVRWFLRKLIGLGLPHYRGKLRIGHRISRSKARPVLFGVTNYYQNDELIRADILAGRYGLPANGAGVNRIDLRDVGEVVARAMTDPAFPSGAYALAGPESVSGARAAQVWSEVLGRPVRYEGDRPDWPDVLARSLSGPKLADFQRSYAFVAKRSMPTSARDVATTTRLLGRPPRRYETYVRDMAERWGRAAA
ncbi:SDR family oxidoreductase [Dactylosporangium sp. NPDC048998]|uniref:SDR family oxidoreductase n=1 Tax=Dactylosporangium sp. NPDC048998 TaxID=3363976 RepID=UPI00371B24B9